MIANNTKLQRRPNRLDGCRDYYDVIVIGSGLAGLTAANCLAKCDRSVLLVEQHYNFGGMATWFRRPGGYIFDISLHGFPVGMIKSCKRYWTREIADSIRQLTGIRFDNPQFQLDTTFDRDDFTRILIERFGITAETVEFFFETVRRMDFYDDQSMTTRELFQQFFPGRLDVWRLLMEPIAYANGSTLDDPAITYGIVFSNFMSKGVYIFGGGTDKLIQQMKEELKRNGVDLRRQVEVDEILIDRGRAVGVVANGRRIRCAAVLSNANLKTTIERMVGPQHLDREFLAQARAVRLNNSSCQVYIGIRPGESIPYVGDLIFSSTHPVFDSDALCAKNVTSRTFSIYYPDMRPELNRYAVVSSTNANYHDWAGLSREQYEHDKQEMIESTLAGLEKYIPGCRDIIDHVEAATPATFEHYTRQAAGATFGTKFEGLQVSMDLPRQVPGLFHAGSVGIIMSGWLGAINYGVIVSNEVDSYLLSEATARAGRIANGE
ncbi:MAG: NAD(P)/FAD-dependent oxidoreductase [Phycisphaerales bacterium]|nr:MAG: NAD(P)/FAD-dependent oxidoreductase [Phycisphaerales bacterium]